MKKIALFNIWLFFIFTFPIMGQTSATYDITFASTWNITDHTSVPGNAHWSKLVGATHKTKDVFLKIGDLATTGIKNIAETGSNSVFNSEVTTEIANGESDQYINGPNLGTATGNILISNLVVEEEFPLLTLVSMIAPSPDWLIALNGYNLLDSEGNWKTSVTLDMFANDSGTDSGTDYTSSNSITNPFQPISMINESPFNGNKIGTLTITLKTVLDVNDFAFFNNVIMYPNPVSDEKIVIGNLDNITLSKIEIFNVSGSKIRSYNENLIQNNLTLSTKKLSSGIYFMKITSDNNKSITRKIIIE